MLTTVEGILSKGTASGWTLCVIGLVGLFGIWRIYVLQSPKRREQDIAEDAQLRVEKRDDIAKLTDRIALLERKVDEANTSAHMTQMKLVSTLAAFRLLASELQKVDPDNPVLKQAMDLIGLAATDDFGVGAGFTHLARLNSTRGIGE